MGPDPKAVSRKLLGNQKITDQVRTSLKIRLSEVLAALLEETAGRPHAALDLFYVRERFGVWNCKLGRSHSGSNRRSPFYSRAAMIQYLDYMGAPSNANRVNSLLIERGLPAAMSLPINGEQSPRVDRPGFLNALMHDTTLLTTKIAKKLKRRFGKVQGDLEGERAETLLALVEGLEPFLDDSDLNLPGVPHSLSSRIFTRECLWASQAARIAAQEAATLGPGFVAAS